MMYEDIYEKMFDSIGNIQICEYLISWYNVVDDDMTDVDIQKLIDLYNDGHVQTNTCKMCNDSGYITDPDTWKEFQGVCLDDDFHIYQIDINGFGVDLCRDCYYDIEKLTA